MTIDIKTSYNNLTKIFNQLFGGCYVTVKRQLKDICSELNHNNNTSINPNKYQLDYSLSKKQSKFIPMPPPNITGKLHMGHALFLTIQDSLNRFYSSTGHSVLWLSGLDHAGLATHDKIIEYMINHNCNDYHIASSYIEQIHSDIILKQIYQMGAAPFGWNEDKQPYIYTLNKTYQTFVLEVLQCLKEDGLLHYNNDNFYLNMDELANELLADIGCNLEEESEAIIKITPKQEIGKLKHFLMNIEQWNISRNIAWGTPFPYDSNLNLIDNDNPNKQSLDTWFNSSLYPIASLLTMWHENINNVQNQYLSFQDILDKFYPAELIETGADILFFWCARMLMIGHYVYKNQHRIALLKNYKIQSKYPFYKIYLHGLIRDKQNRKFSKSLGNGIDPLDLIQQYESQYPIKDALRWTLITKTGPAEDMKFSHNDANLFAAFKLMNKIWNAGKFFYHYCQQNNVRYQNPMNNKHLFKNIQNINTIINNFVYQMDNYQFLIAAKQLEHEFKSWFCDDWIESNKSDIQNGNNMILQEGLYIYLQFIIMFSCFCPFITKYILDDLYDNPS